MKRFLPLLLLAGCDRLPRDTDGTLDRIGERGAVRIGVVDDARADRQTVATLTRRVARDAGVRAVVTGGAGEPLLEALEADEVDLVIGAFPETSPHASEITFTPPVARYTVGGTPLLVRAAVRNGENRWAMLVESASRAVAPAGLE